MKYTYPQLWWDIATKNLYDSVKKYGAKSKELLVETHFKTKANWWNRSTLYVPVLNIYLAV
jgi:hypothetical protein